MLLEPFLCSPGWELPWLKPAGVSSSQPQHVFSPGLQHGGDGGRRMWLFPCSPPRGAGEARAVLCHFTQRCVTSAVKAWGACTPW